MKKILFITTRYPFPVLGGDKIRAVEIIKFLSKKNKVDLICLTDKNHKKITHPKICNNTKIFKISLIKRLIYVILSFIKIEPLQVGFYHSHEMMKHINKIQSNYQTIIFHTLRTCQYLPKNFKGKKILEMTDLISLRYSQMVGQLSIFNPGKYIYLLEKYLVERYEKKITRLFDKSIFVSKEDIKKTENKILKKNMLFIHNGCHINKRLFKFDNKNSKILFIGNINYPPNKYACYEFVKNTLPKLINFYPKITFHIVGEINFFDKYRLKQFNNVVIHGPIKNIRGILRNSICAICNLTIATGFQNKIVFYMSYGIPTIASLISFKGMKLKRNREVIVYKNNNELIKQINKIRQNKLTATALSYYSHKAIKYRYNWSKVLLKYGKII